MLTTNLSTKPFYNEHAVRWSLLAGGVVVALLTTFNVARVIQLSRSDTRLATQASRDEAEARDLRSSAARLRASVDPKALDLASSEARLANDLIDRRTFSWTELFNRFEATLPADVRITSVHPTVDRERGIILGVTVVARTVEDVSQFMENLEATGAFARPRPTDETLSDQGLLQATLEMTYVPGAGRPGDGGAPTR